jgi:DNA-binding transcriptional regulator YdaS (Cro superfamily)
MLVMKTQAEHLNRAIAFFGGIVAAAAKLKVKSYRTIQQWRLQRVPAEWCPIIERETGGLVTCEQLRPDVEWSVLREAA